MITPTRQRARAPLTVAERDVFKMHRVGRLDGAITAKSLLRLRGRPVGDVAAAQARRRPGRLQRRAAGQRRTLGVIGL
jgi:hypothetical protein